MRLCPQHGIILTDDPADYCPLCLAVYQAKEEPDGCYFCGGIHPSDCCPAVE